MNNLTNAMNQMINTLTPCYLRKQLNNAVADWSNSDICAAVGCPAADSVTACRISTELRKRARAIIKMDCTHPNADDFRVLSALQFADFVADCGGNATAGYTLLDCITAEVWLTLFLCED